MKAELILLKNLQLRMAEIDESLHPLVIRAMQEYSDHSAKDRFDRAYEFLDLDITANLVAGHEIFETTFNNMVNALKLAAYGHKTEEG